MIIKLNHNKNLIDVYEFLNRIRDYTEDFYITENRNRIFIKNNLRLIKKILKKYTCYGYFEEDLEGIIFVVYEKGFRPYIKFLTKDTRFTRKLFGYLFLKNDSKNLFIKIKKENRNLDYLQDLFEQIGDRGREALYKRKG